MTRFSLVALACVAVLLSACDTAAPPPSSSRVVAGAATIVEPTATGWTATSPTRGSVALPADDGGQTNLRFAPLTLDDGDLFEAVAGTVRLQNRARDGRNVVSLVDHERRALRAEGVLDGVVRASVRFDAARGAYDAGETLNRPTSVHKRTECDHGVCIEVIEYDYDLTAPTGDGTTVWARGGDPVVVDRLRFVLRASGEAPSPLVLSGFRALHARR